MPKVNSPLLPTSSKTTFLEKFSVKELKDRWLNELGVDIKQEMLGLEHIYLFRCETTRLKFFLPSSAEGSPDLYEKLGYFNWYYLSSKWEYERALEDLNGHSHILEVGCGKGAFVEQAQGLGYSIEGIDMNLQAVTNAQAQGIPISLQSLQDMAKAGTGQFDAVCAFQVLEHVSDPYGFSEIIIGLVKAGGKIIFSVPNANSFLKNQHFLLNMPPHHMTIWEDVTFKFFEEIFPVKISRILSEPLSILHAEPFLISELYLLTKKYLLLKVIFNRFTRSSAIFLLQLAIRIGLGKYLVGHSLYICLEKL